MPVIPTNLRTLDEIIDCAYRARIRGIMKYDLCYIIEEKHSDSYKLSNPRCISLHIPDNKTKIIIYLPIDKERFYNENFIRLARKINQSDKPVTYGEIRKYVNKLPCYIEILLKNNKFLVKYNNVQEHFSDPAIIFIERIANNSHHGELYMIIANENCKYIRKYFHIQLKSLRGLLYSGIWFGMYIDPKNNNITILQAEGPDILVLHRDSKYPVSFWLL